MTHTYTTAWASRSHVLWMCILYTFSLCFLFFLICYFVSGGVSRGPCLRQVPYEWVFAYSRYLQNLQLSAIHVMQQKPLRNDLCVMSPCKGGRLASLSTTHSCTYIHKRHKECAAVITTYSQAPGSASVVHSVWNESLFLLFQSTHTWCPKVWQSSGYLHGQPLHVSSSAVESMC